MKREADKMGAFDAIKISATGLTAERTRMDIIAKNITNANVTRTANGGPYRRQMVTFEEKLSFEDVLNQLTGAKETKVTGNGVKIGEIVEDQSPFIRVYEPGHPDADEEGYVLKPNVETVKEMVDMITASRSYEANVNAINITKGMCLKALEIGK